MISCLISHHICFLFLFLFFSKIYEFFLSKINMLKIAMLAHPNRSLTRRPATGDDRKSKLCLCADVDAIVSRCWKSNWQVSQSKNCRFNQGHVEKWNRTEREEIGRRWLVGCSRACCISASVSDSHILSDRISSNNTRWATVKPQNER